MIGLIDVDSKIPNLALMKISSYYKSLGEQVEFVKADKANLYVSRQAISDSLNNKRKTNIACGKYIFKYEDDLYKSKVMI